MVEADPIGLVHVFLYLVIFYFIYESIDQFIDLCFHLFIFSAMNVCNEGIKCSTNGNCKIMKLCFLLLIRLGTPAKHLND